MSRTIGRRKTDRYRVAIGMVLGALLVTYGLYTGACGKTDLSGPTTVAQQPAEAPVAAAPAPAPTATPGLIGDDPAKALDLACFAGAQMVATYNGPASFADIETWDTDFDNQNPQPRPNLQIAPNVAIGKTVTRTFKACRQGDAAIKGGKESGCFWDKNGNPFTPNTPAGNKATEECRARCTPVWRELEGVRVIDEGWSDYIPDTQPETVQVCYTHQRRYVIHREQNSCTKEIRDKGEKFYETRRVETPCPCVETWIPQEPVRENETAFGACEQGAPQLETLTKPPTVDCPGHKSRTVEIVTYEVNSCSQAQREKTRIKIEEQAPCTAQCEQSFCHTENFSILKGFRWQCQNQPPGTPGHWPGHFNWPHGDFFGPCTEDKCYSITN